MQCEYCLRTITRIGSHTVCEPRGEARGEARAKRLYAEEVRRLKNELSDAEERSLRAQELLEQALSQAPTNNFTYNDYSTNTNNIVIYLSHEQACTKLTNAFNSLVDGLEVVLKKGAKLPPCKMLEGATLDDAFSNTEWINKIDPKDKQGLEAEFQDAKKTALAWISQYN